jgi:hypothetical protein
MTAGAEITDEQRAELRRWAACRLQAAESDEAILHRLIDGSADYEDWQWASAVKAAEEDAEKLKRVAAGNGTPEDVAWVLTAMQRPMGVPRGTMVINDDMISVVRADGSAG